LAPFLSAQVDSQFWKTALSLYALLSPASLPFSKRSKARSLVMQEHPLLGGLVWHQGCILQKRFSFVTAPVYGAPSCVRTVSRFGQQHMHAFPKQLPPSLPCARHRAFAFRRSSLPSPFGDLGKPNRPPLIKAADIFFPEMGFLPACEQKKSPPPFVRSPDNRAASAFPSHLMRLVSPLFLGMLVFFVGILLPATFFSYVFLF